MNEFSLPLSPDKTYSVSINYSIDSSITIPQGVTLIFQGGKLVGSGKLIGNNTKIVAPICQIFGESLNVEGDWCIDRAYPQWFGVNDNAYFGTTNLSDDASIAINKAIKFKGVGEVFIPKGQYAIGNSIRQKYGIILCGEPGLSEDSLSNQGTVIFPIRGNNRTLDGNYMVIVNTQRAFSNQPISPENSDWIIEYSHEHTAIKYIHFLHLRNHNGNIVENIRGIIYSGSITIEHCSFSGLIQGATSTKLYSDQRIITNCVFNPSVINSESHYAFDFYGPGDNACFKQNLISVWAGDRKAILGGVRLNLAYGADIGCNIINHNVLITNSRNVNFYSNHMEDDFDYGRTAQLKIERSTIKIFGNFFEKSTEPNIYISGNNQDNTSSISLEDNDFCYYEGDYKIDKDNNNQIIDRIISPYEIQMNQMVNLKITNNYKYGVRRDNTIIKRPNGIMICDIDKNPISKFNDYSYIFSTNSMLTPFYNINKNNSINTSNNLQTIWASVNSNVRWRKNSVETYKYRAQVIWDINRKIVGKNTDIGIFTPTQNTNNQSIIDGLIFTFSGLSECGYTCIIRFFRESITSSKKEICDVHFCGSTGVWDNGIDINGFPWREETNADDMKDALKVENSIQFTGNNITCSATSQPITGTWKNGDRVYNLSSDNSITFWVYNNKWIAK